MEQKRDFYAKVFTFTGQNSLIEYLFAYDVSLYTNLLRGRLGAERLDDDLLFSIEYHSFACVHLTKRWILQNPHEPPEEYTEKLLGRMPHNLHALVA